MSPGIPAAAAPAVTLPRGLLIADAWAGLGAAVAPLSNASGRPLARTVKLLLDPLVLRPVLNPRFAGGVIRREHAAELRAAILEAGPDLAATAGWFLLLKRARRRAGITAGNPQDLYFQRCFELARLHGPPGPDGERVAAEAVGEIHGGERLTVEGLRRFITDPGRAAELAGLLRTVWAAGGPDGAPPAPAPGPPEGDGRDRARIAAFLDSCAGRPDAALLAGLVADGTGSREAAGLERPGVAQEFGLTRRSRVERPELGERASKRSLPRPFDRSIFERLFAGFTTAFDREAMGELPALVRQEIHRSAAPWQLAREASRLVMVLGRDASAALPAEADHGGGGGGAATDAAARLLSRWRREAYVHRVLRLPDPGAPGVPGEVREAVRTVRQAYLRRLWARLHGRELRGETLAAGELWDVLDGVLRSVIMDQRDRLKTLLEREFTGRAEGGAGGGDG